MIWVVLTHGPLVEPKSSILWRVLFPCALTMKSGNWPQLRQIDMSLNKYAYVYFGCSTALKITEAYCTDLISVWCGGRCRHLTSPWYVASSGRTNQEQFVGRTQRRRSCFFQCSAICVVFIPYARRIKKYPHVICIKHPHQNHQSLIL